MVNNLLQRLGGHGSAQLAGKIGEQVRIRQVKYPNRIPVSFLGAGWNKQVL